MRTQRGFPLLNVNGLSKAFPGVQALDKVSLSIQAGEIHALVGENGAGKSTFLKILAGIHTKDTGEILLENKPISPSTPAQALQLGLSTVHQEISLAPNLTVAENIFVGREPTRGGLICWRELERRTDELLRPFGVHLKATMRVAGLSLALRQIVEIARAISFRPKILMLDEPTSALEQSEVAQLIALLRQLASTGLGILFVTHKLKEVFVLADRVTVLRDGRWVATRAISETTLDEVVCCMVGRDLTQFYPPKATEWGKDLLRVVNLSRPGDFHGITFTLRAGEILGLAGLVGAGRSELAQTIFGFRAKESGQIWVGGVQREIRSPQDALRHGIAYLPEDRKSSGLFPAMTVTDNLVAASVRRHAPGGFIVRKSAECATAARMRELSIRARSVSTRVSLLSGGNQQKILLGRCLETRPRVLIADEPTRGIDVGAKAEIHLLLRRLCAEGMGVIVISSDLPEVLGLCDRVLVMHEGRLAGELSGATASEEAVMRLATGQDAALTSFVPG